MRTRVFSFSWWCNSLFRIFMLFFLYPLFVGFFIQLVALPHLFPSLHAGEGLLKGGDWIYFHRLAKDLAERMRSEGLRVWELRPEGQAPAGITAIFYFLFVPRPWVMLPLNALVHALSGVVLFSLVYDLVGERKSAFLATLPFIFFPSAMNWYAQIHKDGIFALGVLLFLWGWCMLVERKRGIFSLFAIAGGSFVIWIVRPYAVEILGFFSLVAALMLSLVILLQRKKPELWWVTVVFLWIAVFSVNGIARIEKPIGEPIEKPSTYPWSYSPWVPDFLEEKLRGLAEVREQYRFIDPEAMGNIDWEVTFHSVGDVLRYVPRAVIVGFLTPFPPDWMKEGTSPGGALKRRICGLEMIVVYLSLLLLAFTFRRYRKIPLGVVVLFSFLMLLVYALAFPNLGPLYRERYGFLMTLVALGIGGGLVKNGDFVIPRKSEFSRTRRILFLATVDSHIFYFHLPFMELLRSLGYEVEVAAGEAGFREKIEREGFRVHPIPFSRRPLNFSNFLSFWRLLGLLRERRYVLVHVHTPVASFLGRIAAKIARVPLVLYTAHGLHFFRGASWKAWLFWYTAEKIAAPFTDALIVLNEEDFEHGKRLGFIPGENLFLIPGVGVDLQRFRNVDASLRGELGIGDDEVVVTCVAEFIPRKNHSFLLAAWGEVAKRFGQAHLLLVGDGELLEKTRVWAERESLPRAHFLGRRGDVPAVLSASDIVVLVSKHEGLPRALLEGMAAGKPLVATDVRGNRDLVEDGMNGFLVPLGDVAALSEALEQLIGSKKLREKMGEESRKKAEAYSLERVLQEMEGIYRKFLAGSV